MEYIKSKMKNRLAILIKSEVQSALEGMLPILPQLIEFHNCSEEDKQSYYDHTKDPMGNIGYYSSLKERLLTCGVPVREDDIDIQDFEKWKAKFNRISDRYKSMGDVYIEKCLEHYVTYTYLKLNVEDIYIDVAAAGSPWAEILDGMGIKSHRLDLSYPNGIKGINIGCDAGDTGLPDEFATCLSLQCAYECFMGDADIRFIKEASRILKKKGRYAIAPLYLDDVYFVATSPYCDRSKIEIEKEAKKVWRNDRYKVPFSRHYSPESFKERIYSNIPKDMAGEVVFFKNIDRLMNIYKSQKIYCFFMFHCKKVKNLVHGEL